MKERISVDEEVMGEIYNELKARGFSLSEISDEIGSDFRNHLYKSTSFRPSAFQDLRSLYGKPIPSKKIKYLDGRGEVETLDLDKNRFLAEFVGMILGDGHIDKHSYDRGDRHVSSHYLCITLASYEREIIQRAKFLAKKCLERSFNEEKLSHADAVNLKIHGKMVVQAFEDIGLKSGNKVENQVGVPNWIMENREFQRKCLKGLFDTDGSYYKRSEDGYEIVYFKNKSDNLLDDFTKICNNLNIKTSKAGSNSVQVAAQEEVREFIDKISPIKAS